MRLSKIRFTLIPIAIVALHCYAAPPDKTDTVETACTRLENYTNSELDLLDVVADQIGRLHAIGLSALESVKTCPGSARLWYVAARSAEVVGFPLLKYEGVQKIAADAIKHVPQSVQVATVVARLEGSLASAQQAYDLDHNYAPARNVLALALAREGNVADALKLLEGHNTGMEDHFTRARILLRDNKPKQAVAEARAALKERPWKLEEFGISSFILREGEEIQGLALLAMGRTKEAVRALKEAAGLGSDTARSELVKLGFLEYQRS